MESLETTQGVVLAMLVSNIRHTQWRAEKIHRAIEEVLSTLAGGPMSFGVEMPPFEESLLVPLSQLLTERIHHPKYGKNAPLVTVEEANSCCDQALSNLSIRAPQTDVESELLTAFDKQLDKTKQAFPMLSLKDWLRYHELVKRLAKKQGVNPEQFLRQEDAPFLLVRAMTKKGVYEKEALKVYVAAVRQAIDQMVPALVDQTLDGLAGADSPNYSAAEVALHEIQHLFKQLRPRIEDLLKVCIREEVDEIYGD